MKKFNFKTLLVCLLALVMVVALVACNTDSNNKKPNNNKKPPSSTTDNSGFSSVDYFDQLWACSKAIGEEQIGEDDDLGVNAQLEIELGSKADGGRDAGKVQESISLGLDVSLVLDRTANDNYSNTAAKLRLYSGAVEIATLYYFVSDASKLYIDFAGKNIAMNVNLGGELAEDDGNAPLNTEIGKYLAKLVGVGDEDGFNTSIIQLTKDMGNNWDLNKLVGVVLGMIPNFNLPEMLKDLLEDEEMGGTIQMVLNTLKLSVDDLFDEDGNINLYNILTLPALKDFLKCSKSGNTYTCSLDSLMNTLGMFLSEVDGLSAKIVFEEQDGKFKDGVTISADLNSSMFKTTMEDGTKLYPYAVINIKHLNFKNATGKDMISINKSQYSTDMALNLSGKLSLSGLNIDTTPFTQADENGDPVPGKKIQLLGEIAFDLVGKLDLSGTAQSPLTAKLTLTYRTPREVQREEEAQHIIEATLIGDELAFTFTDPKIRYTQQNGNSTESGFIYPMHALFETLGGTLNSIFGLIGADEGTMAELQAFLGVFLDADGKISNDFKGVRIKGVDINSAWLNFGNDLRKQAEDWYKGDAADGSAEEAPAEEKKGVDFNKILDTIKLALNMIDFEDGKISIDGSNLLQRIAQFAGLWGVEGAANWTEENIIDTIVDPLTFLVDDGLEFFKNCYHGLERLLHFEDLGIPTYDGSIALPKHTGQEGDVYTVEELAGVMFKATYAHEYNAETCTGAGHDNCAHLYELSTTAADYILNNEDADRAKAFEILLYGNFFAIYEEALEADPVLAGYNGNDMDDMIANITKGPELFAKWYFVNKVGHEYNAETCVDSEEDHSHADCAQLYKAVKNDYLVAVIMLIGANYVPSFDSVNEMIEKLQRQIQEQGMGDAMALISQIINYVFDLPQLFKDLSSAISVDGVEPYDPDEGNYVAYLFETFINDLEAHLAIDLTDGIDLSIAFGAGGDFAIELDLSLDVDQLPTIQSVYTGPEDKDAAAEAGWYMYTIVPAEEGAGE